MKNRGEYGYNPLGVPADSIKYAPTVGQAPTYQFKNMIDMAGPVTDLNEFDTKMKEVDQRKRDRNANYTMSQTQNQMNESVMYNQSTA